MADIVQLAKELLKVTTDTEKIRYLKEFIEFHESFNNSK